MNARLLALLLGTLAACAALREPAPTHLMIPIAARAEVDLNELAAEWQVPLVVVAGIVYLPPFESVPRASGHVRLALANLAKDPPPIPGALELLSNPVSGHAQFRVRGAGYRRVDWCYGGPLVRTQDGLIRYVAEEPRP